MKIASIMVTYNRISDLKKAIDTYEAQTYLPNTMIIVDNCSTDGTKEFLDQWEKEKAEIRKKVIHLPQNIGGSGGFYEGMKYALQTKCDWLWIADDDAFLDKAVFSNMQAWIERHSDIANEAVAICGAVIDNPKNMNISIGHRRRIRDFLGVPKQKMVSKDEYSREYFEIGLFTYVGSAIKAEAVKKAGLPCKNFFIYYDDLEHSYRIGKEGKMYCVPSCKVYHDAAVHEEAYGSNWRSYYQSRNSTWFLKHHFPVAYYKLFLKRILQRCILQPTKKYSMKNQLDWDALQDARKEKLGISEKYFIGWKTK